MKNDATAYVSHIPESMFYDGRVICIEIFSSLSYCLFCSAMVCSGSIIRDVREKNLTDVNYHIWTL